MEWEGREESKNVDDRRGLSPKAGLAIGGGAVGIIAVILTLLLGGDPDKVKDIIKGGGQQGGQDQSKRKFDPAEERQARFTKVIFRETEVVWEKQFQRLSKEYRKPTLVLYTQQVNSACGAADASVGPFYCPGDESVYIDLSFYSELEKKLGAPGEFARAYVIAHEVGHHVQRLLGYSARVDEARRARSPLYNQMSVRLELQADYLAGVWAHYSKEALRLNREDLESAIKAAYEIGDDRLQRRAGRVVTPHSFTHGTSEQRMRWFREGFKSGDMRGAARLFDLDYREL
jgi:predicted metalloprotease